MMLFAFLILLVYVISYIFATCTEFHTHKIKQTIYNRFDPLEK